MNNSELQNLVFRRARELGITIDGMAKKIGRSRPWLYRAMSGDIKQMKLGTLLLLARAFDVHPWSLFRKFYSFSNRDDSLKVQDEEIRNMEVLRFIDINDQGASLYPGDESVFVRDVTITDGDQIPVKSKFEKIWLIQNIGSVPWTRRRLICVDENVFLVYVTDDQVKIVDSGNLIPLEKEVPIPDTRPGATVQISVTFQAPARPGTVVSYWKMVDHEGNFCFPNLDGVYCKITAF